MSTDTQLIPASRPEDLALAAVEREERLFTLAQRKANVYAQSSLVPREYQKNVGNVLIAENMARRMGADTLMVMQNLYVVHGRPAWSSQFLIASFNTCGRFSAIKYKCIGTAGEAGSGCQAYCTELSTGDVIEGPTITWEMAKAEGWVNKNGSKWKTMPEQMFRYRAASFLIRTTAPEIGMGLLTREELEDSGEDFDHGRGAIASGNGATTLDALTARLNEGAEPAATEPDEPTEQQEATPEANGGKEAAAPPDGDEPQDDRSETPTGNIDDFLAEIGMAENDGELSELYADAKKALSASDFATVADAILQRGKDL